MNTHQPTIHPVLVLSVGILAVSTASIFIRFAQLEAPSLVIAAYRLGIATLILAPVALWKNRSELFALGRSQMGFTLLSGLFLALHFASWITSLEYTTVASSVVIVTTVPLWVALFAPLTIHEPLTRTVLVGMLLALMGGIVVGVSDSCTWQRILICPSASEFLQGDAFLGDLLALFGALMGAGYLIIGRRLRAGISLLSYIFIVYGMAAVVLLVIMFGAGFSPFGYSAETYLWLFLLALVPQLLGHSSYNWALGYLPAAFVSVTLLGEPLGSAILAYFLLDEVPTVLKIFGAILILIGIYVTSRTQSKANG